MSKDKFCSHCGAKTVEYPFTFNKGLAACLRKMRPYLTLPVEIKTLNLTTSQWTNFQKLRYWGFIEPVIIKGHSRKGGWWLLTERGDKFLKGKLKVPEKVWMYRNNFLKYEGKEIFMSDVLAGYDYRADYSDNAKGVEINAI